MISEENLIKATEEIRDIVERYAEKSIDRLLIIQYTKWLLESTVLTLSLKDAFGFELVKK